LVHNRIKLLFIVYLIESLFLILFAGFISRNAKRNSPNLNLIQKDILIIYLPRKLNYIVSKI